MGEAACAQDHYRILLRYGGDDRAGLDADAVGHHYQTGLVAAADQMEADRFGRTMDMCTIVVNPRFPKPGDECIEQFGLSQSYIRKDVLGKHMEGTNTRCSCLLCNPDCGGFQREGL